MAVAAVNSVPMAATIDSASPHWSKLVDETLAGSFLDELPQRLIGPWGRIKVLNYHAIWHADFETGCAPGRRIFRFTRIPTPGILSARTNS